MRNVGGSAGDGGFQFQAKIIAFVAVHILAETALTGRNIEGIPVAVGAETNGPGDDIRIELTQPVAVVELQAKKGLRVDTRFDKTIHKIASGLVVDAASNVILAVNRQSGNSIKEKLSADLDRLRQGREDAPHDQKLLNRVLQIFACYTQNQEHARSLAKRLSICLFDLGDTSSYDTQIALTLLRFHILGTEKQAEAAWNILVQAGHTLIESRGRYGATAFVRLLQSQNIHLLESILPVVKSRYQAWVLADTATFRIPGPHLGLSLPIDSTWTDLHVLSKKDKGLHQNVEEQLLHYHNWEHFTSRSYQDSYDALDVAKIGRRVVIVGGPGAGKSTLCRKLTHNLTDDFEELVMRVHLPNVVTRIQNGMSINTALVDAATDGFNSSLAVREALFAQADSLVADGLDECDVFIVMIAQALQRWSTDYPKTRILITMRPIGYESKFFSDWEVYDLLPLTKDEVERSAQQIIIALAHDPATVTIEVKRFQQQLEGNTIASIASRNPLLLVFLLELFLEGISLDQERASLYEQILDLCRVSLPQDRNWLVPQLDVTLAWRSLELLAWFLLFPEKSSTTRSNDQLLQRVSYRLAHEMNVQPATVTLCVQFWHERGVLDRLQIGHKEVYTFVHATFNEYVAGRYLTNLNVPEIQQWVRDNYGNARWRETLLLAAGSGAAEVIVETLLAIDAKNDQGTLSLLLAALAEAPSQTHTFAVVVAKRLVAQLVSAEQSNVYTYAEQGAVLVRHLPDIFAPLLLPLFQHPQQWTRLAAIYLTIMSDELSVGIEQLDAYFDDIDTTRSSFRKGGGAFAPGWSMHNKVVIRGAEVLARLRPDTATKERIKRIYTSSMISSGTQMKLRPILHDLGCQMFIEEQEKGKNKQWLALFTIGNQADEKMLETILRLTSSSFTTIKKRRKLSALTVLLSALRISEAVVGDWDVLGRLDDGKAIEAVLLGYITGLQLDKEEVAQDAAWVVTELRKARYQGKKGNSLLSLLPKFPSEREIHTISFSDMLIQDLTRALEHPSAIIVRGAVQLLAKSGETGKEVLTSLLFTSSNEQILSFLAEIAAYLWGIQARPLFNKRIEQGYTLESIWLIEELPHLPGNHEDPQFQHVLLQALYANDPRVAIAAVHALQELAISLLKQMSFELQNAHLYWVKRGEEGKITSYYMAKDCPTCRTDPGNARTHVSHLLKGL